MELKSRSRSYSCLNEIHADILTIRHNVAVFHGCKYVVESALSGDANLTVEYEVENPRSQVYRSNDLRYEAYSPQPGELFFHTVFNFIFILNIYNK